MSPSRPALLALAFSVLPAVAAAERLRADYVVRAAGVAVAEVTAEVTLEPARWRVETRLRTVGVAGAVVRGEQTTRSEGGWRAGVPQPGAYVTAGTWRGTARRLEMVHERGEARVRLLEPDETALRLPVADEQRRGTVDALTGLLRLSVQVRDTGGCDARAALFDGRRRSEATVRAEGRERIAPSGDDWAGEALRCAYESRVVAGFPRDQDPAAAGRPWTGTAWVAPPRPGLPPLPVRIEAGTAWLGTVRIVLTRVETLPDAP